MLKSHYGMVDCRQVYDSGFSTFMMLTEIVLAVGHILSGVLTW
jgi:hypothetical protein